MLFNINVNISTKRFVYPFSKVFFAFIMFTDAPLVNCIFALSRRSIIKILLRDISVRLILRRNSFISISPLRLLRLADGDLNSLALRNGSVSDGRLSLVLRLHLTLIHLLLAFVTPENSLALLGIDLVDEVFEVLLSLSELGFCLLDVLRGREAVDLPLCLPDLTLQGSLLLFQLVPALTVVFLQSSADIS